MFRNRKQAGFLLGKKLRRHELFAKGEDQPVMVYALSLSALPIAAEIATALDCALEPIFLDESVASSTVVGACGTIESESVSTTFVSERIRTAKGAWALLVDDGIDANDLTRVTIASNLVRQHGAVKVLVVAPVVASIAYRQLEKLVDDVVAILMPERKKGISEYFMNFEPVYDFEIPSILSDCNGDHMYSVWH